MPISGGPGGGPITPVHRSIILADGENLVFRFQTMVEQGRKPNEAVIHIPDIFVWHPNICTVQVWQPIRANYYTSVVGTEDKIKEVEESIAKVEVKKRQGTPTQVCPRVFKKIEKSRKTRIVDIAITIEALRHSYHGHVDTIFLLTGDGDFLTLVHEIMRQGTQVWLGAFSSGLEPRLRTAVDKFINLDEMFFRS